MLWDPRPRGHVARLRGAQIPIVDGTIAQFRKWINSTQETRYSCSGYPNRPSHST
jgi:hypothetical protein